MLSQKVSMCSMNCIYFTWWQKCSIAFFVTKTSRNASIHKLPLKNKPTVRTIPCSESKSPLYLYTLWCTYIQALFLVTVARLSSTLVQSSRKRQQGSWPSLFTAISAPKLTSGGTLRSTDMETNKCFFYLRAPIMSSAANGGTGWLWQSNGPASLFPCVPDGNLSTLSYKLHFQKSHFHLDPNTDMRARQKEEHVLHRMLMASVFTASQSELLCVARRQWCDLLARPEVRLWSRVSVTQIIRFVSVVH